MFKFDRMGLFLYPYFACSCVYALNRFGSIIFSRILTSLWDFFGK